MEYVSKTLTYFNGKIETYKTKFNESDLMNKISSMGKKAGVTTVYYALLLYYALLSDSIPVSKRLIVIAALGYFISPFDFIPDFILAGLLDDASVLMFAVNSILPYITDDIKLKVKSKLGNWFNEEDIASIDTSTLQLFQKMENTKADEESNKPNEEELKAEIANTEEEYRENLNTDFETAEKFLVEKKYDKALPILERMYNLLTLPGDHDALIDELGEDRYNELVIWLCFNIGYCYNDQKDYIKAFYYLHQVRCSGDPRCFVEWINAIVNGNHPSALDIVEGFVNDPDGLMELWNEEEDKKMIMDFLERRLGYLYIEYGRLHEARLLFTRLLSNPNSKKFAQEELDYLDHIEMESDADNQD